MDLIQTIVFRQSFKVERPMSARNQLYLQLRCNHKPAVIIKGLAPALGNRLSYDTNYSLSVILMFLYVMVESQVTCINKLFGLHFLAPERIEHLVLRQQVLPLAHPIPCPMVLDLNTTWLEWKYKKSLSLKN